MPPTGRHVPGAAGFHDFLTCPMKIFTISLDSLDIVGQGSSPYRLTIKDQDQCPGNMAGRGNGNHHPDENAIVCFGGSFEESQVAKTERGLEAGDADLVERATCIVELGRSVDG